jgi:predicted Zn-dependent protease
MADFLVFFDMAVAYAGLPSISNLAQLLAYGSIASFSRDNEREADQFGHRFLVENNYDPREAAKIWDQLIRESKAADERTSRSVFFASHPPPDERSETLMSLAKKAIGDGHPGETGRQRFLDIMLPHRKSFLRDDLRVGHYSQTLELLKQLIEDGENVAELKYFEGEVYRLRQKEGDFKKALEAYQSSLKSGAAPVEIHRSLGMIYLKTDEKAKAKESFMRYLELLPDAPDSLMIRHMIGATS